MSSPAMLAVKNTTRVCIIDGYPKTERRVLGQVGMTLASDLYQSVLLRNFPDLTCDILYIADPETELKDGVGLSEYDAYVWTGSKLTIFHKIPEVQKQIEFSRRIFSAGIPQFGSCWGVQMAAVAAGGEVQAMKNGRETFVVPQITLTEDGKRSRLYEGKPEQFAGFINHLDEVTQMPSGAKLLATGDHCHIQALEVIYQGGTFWGIQYHPEYNFFEIAMLTRARSKALIDEGFYADLTSLMQRTELMFQLHENPNDQTLQQTLGVNQDITSDSIREKEIQNFFRHLVFPHQKR